MSAVRYRTTDVESDASSFDDLLLPKPLVQALADAGFHRPSPVQKLAIPLGLVGTDLIVQAKSGTGKTCVFAVIALQRVRLEVHTPQVLALAPTREVALQSSDVIQGLAAGLPVPAPVCVAFVGGLPTIEDQKRLRRTCHIAVATPGRLCALLASGALQTQSLRMLVLDEADQLMGDGFYPDVAWIHAQLPTKKQVLAFSATYTAGLLGDLEPLMKRPQKVLLCEETVSLQGIRQFYRLVSGPEEGSLEQPAGSHAASSTAANMQQQEQDQPQQPPPPQHQQLQQLQAPKQQSSRGEPQPETDVPLRAPEDDESLQRRLLSKVAALLEVLSRVSFHQAIVFCNRKPAAEWLAHRLSAAGYPSAHLSSDLPQPERMAAMSALRGFLLRVMVCTDVMARGVDLDRVNLVALLDLPPDAATYVHRVGRTGRFGTRGISIAFVTPPELQQLKAYMDEARGGSVDPLPAVIPEDLYSFQLEADWEEEALQELLAAPATTPPDSPPPVRTKLQKKKQNQQQQAPGEEQEEEEEEESYELYGQDGGGPSAWQEVPPADQNAAAWDGQQYGSSTPGGGGAVQGGAQDWESQQAWQQWQAWQFWQAWQEYYAQQQWQGEQQQYQQQQQQQGVEKGRQEQQKEQPQQQDKDDVGEEQVEAKERHNEGQHQQLTGGMGVVWRRGSSSSTLNELFSSESEVDALGSEEVEEGEEGEYVGPQDEELDWHAQQLLSRMVVVEDPPGAQQAGGSAGGSREAADAGTPGQPASEPGPETGCAAESHSAGEHGAATQAAWLHGAAEAAAAGQQHSVPVAGCHYCWLHDFSRWQRDFMAWQQEYAAWQHWWSYMAMGHINTSG